MTSASQPAFEKVGECLYRYTPTGMYYARFEIGGREVRLRRDGLVAEQRLAGLFAAPRSGAAHRAGRCGGATLLVLTFGIHQLV